MPSQNRIVTFTGMNRTIMLGSRLGWVVESNIQGRKVHGLNYTDGISDCR